MPNLGKTRRASTDDPRVLAPVRANAGIQAQYRRRLLRMIRAMHKSVLYWVKTKYRQGLPKIAEDAEGPPSENLQETLNRLAEQWEPKFDEGSQKLAEWFAQKTKNYTDGSLRRILQDAGFAVPFQMTDRIQDVYESVINEQVGLIKSIPSHYLTEVQGLVMRSVQQGRDLGWLTSELSNRYGITKRRAALIARDQNNKATSVMSRVRHQELGITEAIWRHSHGGKHPRPSHLRADGKKYDVKKGMYIDGEWIWPGEKINCRCTAQPLVPGLKS